MEQAAHLLYLCKQQEPMIYLPMLLAVTAGLRISEITGLRYSDIDFLGKKQKKVKKTAGLVLNKEQEESFEILRALRGEIEREEKVPPYIVFSDKTLVQMCIDRPNDKGSMLEVSGVGEFKFEKYGERFLEVIRSWT